ncbi:arylsulfatase B-like isoform X1 [Acropora muricata]|uniref:arylsulfatase B-like isoform X1 n=1 Tax=Acropora muricata TaxID=159855 RepID=UPI0034E5D84C
MASRKISVCSSLCLLVLISAHVQVESKRSQPHILFMLADDLGWIDVGLHGSKIHTPNIDSLAKDGVILDNFYAQPVCTPARGALMTGRYPIHTGLQHAVIHPSDPFGLPLDFQTLPGQLRDVGYATHLVGKWHLGFYKWPYIPPKRGFDTAYGFWNGDEDHFNHKRDGVVDFRNGTDPVTNLDGKYATYEYVKRIQEIVRYHNPEQPLFLYMAFQNVHNPIQAPEEYVKKYDFIDQRMRRVHAGMVDILDEAVGNISKAFKDKGLWEDTLTIFCTDNGGEPVFGGYNWPLRGTKHTLWEGGVRSTGFVHGKMLKRKGAKCDGLLHISDFFPTLINLAGGKFDPRNPIPVDGFDVWKTISQGDPSPRTEILLNIDNVDPNATLPGIYQGMGLRMGSMKLLMNVPNTTWFKPPELGGDFPEELLSNGLIAEETDEDVLKALMDNYLLTAGTLEVALYNITADPEERNDLSQVLPDVVKKMKERMDYYINSSVPPLFKGTDPNALKIARKNGIWGPWM